jgi:hypothetical protein
LVSCSHCVVYPSAYGFWILRWYLVAIVLYILRFTASDYPFGIMWPLRCISFGLRLLIVPLVSCDHCVVYPSVYGFSLSLWYHVTIVLYILRFTASDYPFGILWPLRCISFGLRLLIVPLVSCDHCVVYPSAYGFWLPLWYLVVIVLYILRLTASDYPFGILWPLCCISFGLRLLITLWYLQTFLNLETCTYVSMAIFYQGRKYGHWLIHNPSRFVFKSIPQPQVTVYLTF